MSPNAFVNAKAGSHYRNKAGKRTHLRLVETRPKSKGKKPGMPALRCAQIDRLIDYRFGRALPDDDCGVEIADIWLQHRANSNAKEKQFVMDRWLCIRCPWMTPEERSRRIDVALAKPKRYKADQLGNELGLTIEERDRLAITTIGPVGMSKRERTEARKKANAAHQQEKRIAAGATPRSQSLSQLKPWEAEGISRRTWERQRKQKPAYAIVKIRVISA